ncbi:hypothetical protein M501DRAFT_1015761 [Patellaria atrata CBS 101060]|uniref:Uncharacterized protein n=1 Tax=Patellaria atrata CBS 101060 TaxID=1346257 RepID=A0A9P4VNF5_9PEZI|nr:hypothetical protein M501DRAFT_1015761 [Patellaria atrata CBS 101060]
MPHSAPDVANATNFIKVGVAKMILSRLLEIAATTEDGSGFFHSETDDIENTFIFSLSPYQKTYGRCFTRIHPAKRRRMSRNGVSRKKEFTVPQTIFAQSISCFINASLSIDEVTKGITPIFVGGEYYGMDALYQPSDDDYGHNRVLIHSKWLEATPCIRTSHKPDTTGELDWRNHKQIIQERVGSTLGKTARNINKVSSQTHSLTVEWESAAPGYTSNYSDSEFLITLHKEEQYSDFQSLIINSKFKPSFSTLIDCECPRKTSRITSGSVTFDGLDLNGLYFPTICTEERCAFYSISPDAARVMIEANTATAATGRICGSMSPS